MEIRPTSTDSTTGKKVSENSKEPFRIKIEKEKIERMKEVNNAIREALIDGKIDEFEAKELQNKYGVTESRIAIENAKADGKIDESEIDELQNKYEIPEWQINILKNSMPLRKSQLSEEAMNDPVKYLKEHPEFKPNMEI